MRARVCVCACVRERGEKGSRGEREVFTYIFIDSAFVFFLFFLASCYFVYCKELCAS